MVLLLTKNFPLEAGRRSSAFQSENIVQALSVRSLHDCTIGSQAFGEYKDRCGYVMSFL